VPETRYGCLQRVSKPCLFYPAMCLFKIFPPQRHSLHCRQFPGEHYMHFLGYMTSIKPDLNPMFSKATNERSAIKVPQVTLAFWIIKCCATTVGETLSDYFAETLALGLGIAAAIFFPILLALLIWQFYTDKYVPPIYWLCVVFMSICGTIFTDGLHDDLGVELWIEVIVFSFLVCVNFMLWYYYEGTLDIHSIKTFRTEFFFWMTVLFTFALGTAVGDGISEAAMVGYGYTLLIFAGALLFIAALWMVKALEPVTNFWLAYIMTRPFGAACGDLLAQTKSSHAAGLGTATTSLIFSLIIIVSVCYLWYTGQDLMADQAGPETADDEEISTRKVRRMFPISTTGITDSSLVNAASLCACRRASRGLSSWERWRLRTPPPNVRPHYLVHPPHSAWLRAWLIHRILVLSVYKCRQGVGRALVVTVCSYVLDFGTRALLK
jgi:uncharacterized membrane-anchored protein